MTNEIIKDLVAQVKRNCRISDARHAGTYSVCGLALRLRDLYKWEHHKPPWVEDEPSRVLEWIGEREADWEDVETATFNEIIFDHQSYPPFEAVAINQVLAPMGYYYGAGYARVLKPTFFLATLDKKIQIDGFPVYILGSEQARDLATLPALSQNGEIIIRKDAGQYYFWDQLFFVKPSGKKALAYGLRDFKVTPDDTHKLQTIMPHLFDTHIDTYIHHELGEIRNAIFPAEKWREIFAAFAGTPVELLARAVKDLLADTGDHGLLGHIVTHRRTTALAFYAAFIDGLLKEMFPEIREAFDHFMQSRDWDTISQAVQRGNTKARHTANGINQFFEEGQTRNDLEWARRQITAKFLVPLGLTN